MKKIPYIYFIVFLIALIALAVGCVYWRMIKIEPNESSEIITVTTALTSLTTTTIDETVSETTYTTEELLEVTTEETTEEVLETQVSSEEVSAEPIVSDTTFTVTITEEVIPETESITTTTTFVEGGKIRDLIQIGSNFKGTYYLSTGSQVPGNTQGGSGRILEDCKVREEIIKGSVACKSAYDLYGYNYNGARTVLYIQVPDFPEMTGYYYLDDCCACYNIVDFYFEKSENCPFEKTGCINELTVYLAP